MHLNRSGLVFIVSERRTRFVNGENAAEPAISFAVTGRETPKAKIHGVSRVLVKRRKYLFKTASERGDARDGIWRPTRTMNFTPAIVPLFCLVPTATTEVLIDHIARGTIANESRTRADDGNGINPFDFVAR